MRLVSCRARLSEAWPLQNGSVARRLGVPFGNHSRINVASIALPDIPIIGQAWHWFSKDSGESGQPSMLLEVEGTLPDVARNIKMGAAPNMGSMLGATHNLSIWPRPACALRSHRTTQISTTPEGGGGLTSFFSPLNPSLGVSRPGACNHWLHRAGMTWLPYL